MKNDSSNPRIRFNWGFHDGTHDKSRKVDRRNIIQGEVHCLPKWDDVYNAGYIAGQSVNMLAIPESSEPAWKEYVAERVTISARRKELQEMRIEMRVIRC